MTVSDFWLLRWVGGSRGTYRLHTGSFTSLNVSQDIHRCLLLCGITSHLSQQTALWESQAASPLSCRGTSAALHTACLRKLFIVLCLFKIKNKIRNCLPDAVIISPFNNIFIGAFIICSDVFQSSLFIEMYLLSTSYSWRITIWTKCVIELVLPAFSYSYSWRRHYFWRVLGSRHRHEK